MKIGRAATIRVTTLALTAIGAAYLGPTNCLRATYAAAGVDKTASGWTAYNGHKDGDHYSPLTQINRANVAKLKVAWTFDTREEGGLQTNPLIVGHRLFAYTPSQKVVALDGASGKVIWTFEPEARGQQPTRGFSYWTDGKSAILFAGALTNLYALDPQTGKLISTFADGGKLDLRKSLTSGDYTKDFAALTTPGVIYKDMIIVGFRAPESEPALHGDIRAFDVHTGALRWTFHTIPMPGEYGYDTWPKEAWKTTGAANNWAGMALDEEHGVVYVPTGSAVNDFYGYDRIGKDLFANSLVALDANTGKRIWHFQGVHHDIWDRDFPSPPVLLTIHREGKSIEAIAQPTKQGFLYLFDRATGHPLFPIEERLFPSSTVPGEQTSPTQPVPLVPEPYARQLLTEDMLTTRTPEAHAWAQKEFKTLRSEGQFVPLSVDKQTVVFPGFDGGAEWGGPAVDPRTGVIYINANDIPWTGGLTKNKAEDLGSTVYQSQCALCHGGERKGSPPTFPSLIDIDQRLSDAAITNVIHNGRGRMPSFPNITDTRLEALLNYVKAGGDHGASGRDKSRSTMEREAAPESAAVLPARAGNPTEIGGAKLYEKNCAICHGGERKGSPPTFPSLIDIDQRLSDAAITNVIHNGRGRMPSFPNITDTCLEALLNFVKTGSNPDTSGSDKSHLSVGREAAPESAAVLRSRAGNPTEIVGAKLYEKNCAICHGNDLLGAPSNYPALVDVRARLGDKQILANIHEGKGRMPAFKKLTDADTSAILRFLGDSANPITSSEEPSSKREATSTAEPAVMAKYLFTGYKKFLDPDGYPAVAPPWGTLNAIDLNTGKYLWKIPLGEYPGLAAKGMKNTGSENYGGPIVTAGGVVIIAGTIYDRKIRAFDSKSGERLWEALLPYTGNATPATYMVDGKQYVVIAASGARDGKGPRGAAYVAFALP